MTAYHEILLKDEAEAKILYKDLMTTLRKSYIDSVGSELSLIEEYLSSGIGSKTTLGTIRSPYLNDSPSHYTLTSSYGVRLRNRNVFHRGVDLATGGDKTIVSIANGEVVASYPGADSMICISHSNLPCTGAPGFSVYLHCVNIRVKVGDVVRMGDPIGTEGGPPTYGSHLHFELRDANYQCIDPAEVLNLTPANKQLNLNDKAKQKKIAEKAGLYAKALASEPADSINGVKPPKPKAVTGGGGVVNPSKDINKKEAITKETEGFKEITVIDPHKPVNGKFQALIINGDFTVGGKDITIEKNFALKVIAFLNFAHKNGYSHIKVKDGYRTYETQKKYWDAYQKFLASGGTNPGIAANPEVGQHRKGQAVDFFLSGNNTLKISTEAMKDYNFIKKQGERFGLYNNYGLDSGGTRTDLPHFSVDGN